jgi:hypothetical protein
MVHADGHDWHDRHRELTEKFNELLLEEREEYGDLPRECARIMRNYLKYYDDDDQHWRVIDTEIDEVLELPNGDKFNFIIDKIVESLDDGALWLVDYKTVKSFMPEGFMLLDAQLARYFWAARKMGYTPLAGAMFDEICTKPPTPPKVLKNGTLSQAKSMWCDYYTYLEVIKREKLDPQDYRPTLLRLKSNHDKFFRRTPIPRDAPMMKQLMRELVMTADEIKDATARKHFPRTARKECLHDCDYLDLCTMQLQGGEMEDIIKLKYDISKRGEQEEHLQWPTK